MKQILDYSQYLEESAFADRDPGVNALFKNTHFFNRFENDICPFCKVATRSVHERKSDNKPDWLNGGAYLIKERVWSCVSCGWWKLRVDKDTTGAIDAKSVIIKNAILKKYDVSGKDIPISVLGSYLKDNFEEIIHIDDRKMEQLVQSVFSEHFECEVTHVGKSGDGGIDLILVDSYAPAVVQVKRRKSLNVTESVSCVREFLGAAQLAESKNLIYVSTCNKFSDPAIKAKDKALNLQLVDSYELYNFERFRDVLRVARRLDRSPAWLEHINID